MLQSNGTKPIYIQIAEWLETEILNGQLTTDSKVFSQYQLAEMFTINPATAAKGLNVLADDGILYKKRGLGMFVAEGAREKILTKRKSNTLVQMIDNLVQEADYLGVPHEELVRMMKAAEKRRKEEKQ
ncbi:GntR family transcriptional regulator [Evansella halocellulosilytica]|uniref:GntR family transcriptional regulator n=1 Tax=Evansella halocellulosilytica TaxID=2011013 RepID=UPI000BB6A20B|nr:GntR family transcriptional regulator [Evansella halocellulosilytica]